MKLELRSVAFVSAFALSLVLATAGTSARTLTFDERVRAQAAIERVSYSHQIAAEQPFEQAIGRSVLEAKVRRYILQSTALEQRWNRPVTAAMLEQEVERMVRRTRMPERLRELFDSLGNDTFLIQECLARPVLVDRLARESYALDATFTFSKTTWDEWWEHAATEIDERDFRSTAREDARLPQLAVGGLASFSAEGACADAWSAVAADDVPDARSQHVAVWTGDRMVIWGGASNRGDARFGGQYDEATDTWSLTSIAGAPVLAEGISAIWTGSRMIVWGGFDSSSGGAGLMNTGRIYDPATDSWTPTSTVGAPSARYKHVAVWTGARMIVWGGYDGTYTQTGGVYDPASATWTSISTVSAPPGREAHAAVWTGSKMVVWGGAIYPDFDHMTALDTGGSYDPSSNTWTATSTIGAPSARLAHTLVWTGTHVVVWGGSDTSSAIFDTGGRYDLVTDTWTPTSTTGAPVLRAYHTAVWTGTRMVVWGGSGFAFERSGGQYDPVGDTWTATSTLGAPSARAFHTAVWTGSRMLIWGGEGGAQLDTGGSYDPATDTWTATAAGTGPTGRARHTAVWTGSKMVVWGGDNLVQSGHYGDGWQYDPATDSWTPMSMTGAPAARTGHTAVWTGSRMLVWGGTVANNPYFATGGSYDPVGDTWTATSTVLAPSARAWHSAVWTGQRMVVWGGYNGALLSTGGRYDPVTDTWSSTSTASAPLARDHHTGVWTGTRMIVWGGFNGTYLATGSAYDPASDSWSVTSMAGAPSARSSHRAVWTGDRMIVWGGSGPGVTFNTGGRYDAVSDTWLPVSTANAPSGRANHTLLWTGSRMMVWGGGGATGLDTGGAYDPGTDTWTAMSMTNVPRKRHSHSAIWTGTQMIVWGGALGTGTLNDGGIWSEGTDQDADSTPDCRDNCPAVSNPLQQDADADLLGDACDCAPADPSNSLPEEAQGLRVGAAPSDDQTITWNPITAATRYGVVRGELAFLPVGPGAGDESCFDLLSGPTFSDSTVPAGGFFYLARGENDCGRGTWGTTSNGSPRTTMTCP